MDKELSFNEKLKAAAENKITEYPRVEIFGNRLVRIEGHSGITEYGSEKMQINCGKIFIRVTGDSLELKALNNSELAISGHVVTVEYVN